MAQGDTDGDDLAVNLSWPATGPVAPGRRDASAAPGPTPPSDPAPPDEALPRKAPARQAPAVDAPVRTAPAPVRQAARPDATRVAGPVGPPPAKRRPRPKDGAGKNGASPNETLVSILDHLSTLSRLVTGTSKASTAELEALGSRMDKAVADLDALQLRVIRSLAGFDALRLRMQKEMAERPPLSDDEVERIADAVTQRLLENVRVETEEGQR